MTGIVKSAGCKVCKQRRVKCDETQPQCLRCQKIGRVCPGPDPQFRFIQQRRQNAGQGEGYRSSTQHRDRPESIPFLVKQQRKSHDGGLYQTMEILPGSSKWEKRRSPFPPGMQMTDADQLSASLVDIMKIIPESPGMSMSTLHDFFTFVPSRIGNNQTLDAAISCLVQGYHSLIRQWPIDRKPQDDDAYLNALRKLQLSLDDPRERNSAETLCGALVLATYEFFRSKSPGDIQWLAHAGGAAAMLQARGPNAFTTDFEQSLLLAHHEAVVFYSIFQGTKCYLNSDEWLYTLEQSLSELPATNAQVNADRLFHSTLYALGTLPELIHKMRALGPNTSSTECGRLLKMARQFKSHLLALAQFHETGFFSGEATEQRIYIHSEPNPGKRPSFFPPPSRQLSDGTNSNPTMKLAFYQGDYMTSDPSSPELSASILRVEYCDRHAAKRHLWYWSAVLLSNIILLRLEPVYKSAELGHLSPSKKTSSRVDRCHGYYHVGEELERSESSNPIVDKITQQRAVQLRGQNGRITDWSLSRSTESLIDESQHYRLIDPRRGRSALTPFIPSNFEIPALTTRNPLSPALSHIPSTLEPLSTDVTAYGHYQDESLVTSFSTAHDSQLPSPPEELLPTQSSLGDRAPNHYSASSHRDETRSRPTNLVTDDPTFSSNPDYSSPLSSKIPPRAFLTSPTISPHVQNAYLHSLILHSLPYAFYNKPFGALYMLFPFQMAASISTPAQKEWIATALTELFGDLHLTFSRDKTWTAPTFMDDVDQIARDAGIFHGERLR